VIGLWIGVALLAIVLFVLLILLAPIRLVLTYAEAFRVHLSVFGLRFPIYPRKKKVRIRDYSKKRMQKRRLKALKKRRKEQEKAKKKNAVSSKKKKESAQDKIGNLKTALQYLVRIQKHLRSFSRIRIVRLKAVIAAEDASRTALLCGSVSALFSYLLELADQFLNCHYSPQKIAVIPNYCGAETSFDVKIVVTTDVLHVLKHGVPSLIAFLQFNSDSNEINNQTEEHKNGE